MRRHFSNPALESQREQETAARVALESISLEEEALIVQDAAETQNEVVQELAEAERVVEIADALEDLAVVTSQIEEATPAEAALIEMVGDVAAAGTDVPAEEIVPAMEGYVGKKIGLEGIDSIKATALNIWKNIVEFLKKIWAKIEAFFHKIAGAIPRRRRSLKDLRGRIDTVVGKSVPAEKATFDVSGAVAYMSVDGKVVKSGAEFISALGDYSKIVEFVAGEHADNIARIGENLAKAISDFDPKKGEESAKAVVGALDKTFIDGIVKGGSSKKEGDFKISESKGTLGNAVLRSRVYEGGEDRGLLGQVEAFRHSTIKFGVSPDLKNIEREGKIAPLSQREMETLVDMCDDMLETLEKFERGSKFAAINKARKSMEAAADKAAKAYESSSSAEDEKASLPYFRSMAKFNVSFGNWASEPAMVLHSHTLHVVNAAIVLINKSIAAYK